MYNNVTSKRYIGTSNFPSMTYQTIAGIPVTLFMLNFEYHRTAPEARKILGYPCNEQRTHTH
jgi:hypothetical protein